MAGLLDFMNTDEARMGLGLLAAAGPRSDGAGFGQRMMEGIGYADQYKQGQQKSKFLQMQMDEAQAKMEQEKAAREMATRSRQAAMESFISPDRANAMSMGPMPDGSNMPTVASGFDDQKYISSLYGLGDVDGAMKHQQAIQKDNKPISLAEGASLVRPDGTTIFKGTPKAESLPSSVREFQFAQNNPGFNAWALAQKRAGASSIVNNMGDNLGLKPKDRFDMEDKMRNDYSAATKNDTEIISTAQDLKDILKQGGALKDQAAIYKFAKSLDPQGAVREADYAAIVKTAGGLDYVTSLVNKAVTGEQLSAKQRTEMTSLMDSMAAVAKQRVGKVQGRYGANAKMYNLKPENIFQQQTDGGDGWAIVPGAK